MPETLQAQEIHLWAWTGSGCDDCQISFTSSQPILQSVQVQAFLQALSDEKANLQSLYGIHGQEYTLLAQMAVGILGRESDFFQSHRYYFKEQFPQAIRLAKNLNFYGHLSLIQIFEMHLSGQIRKPSENSRGPTQIKIIPAKIADAYHITPKDLVLPKNAAVATMGFLIEALQELKRRALNNKWEHVTSDNYVDYLPYIYFGGTKKLLNQTATPETNIYVREMKKYMGWVTIYEQAPGSE